MNVAGTDALAVRGRAIVRVGSSSALSPECVDPCRIVDVAGGFVMPGFHDAHAHPFAAGRRAAGLHVRSGSIPKIQDAVRSYAAAHATDPWILGEGWLSALFPVWPTAGDLDVAESARPVVLTDGSGHNVWLNSAALAAAGVTETTPDPPGGQIAHPLGVLLDSAQLLVTRKEPELSDDTLASYIQKGLSELLAVGVTSTAEGGTESFHTAEIYAKLDREGKLAQRIFLWAPLHASPSNFERWVRFSQSLPREGKVQVAAFKGFADGTMVARTAALLQPYADAPSSRGNLYYPQEELDEEVERANAAGFPVAIHAIGDRAVRQALDAFEHSRSKTHHSLVNRVEHVNVVDPADVPRFAALGVAASVQPIWLRGYPNRASFNYLKHLGEARAKTAYAWNSLARSHAVVLFGSDMPSSPLFDPITGIHAAMTRTLGDGDAFLPDEAMSGDSALRAYTSATPAVMGWGARLGKLEPGFYADIVWLDHDPRTGSASIADDPIRRVWIAGIEVPVPN